MTDAYETMTIPQLKAEIDSRLQEGEKVYTSKTKKADLIAWLEESDAQEDARQTERLAAYAAERRVCENTLAHALMAELSKSKSRKAKADRKKVKAARKANRKMRQR